MPDRVPVGGKKAAHVPGHCEVPSHYNRPRDACLLITVGSVPRLCRACPGVNIRLLHKLFININKLMVGWYLRAGTRHRRGGSCRPVFLRLASGEPLLSQQGI